MATLQEIRMRLQEEKKALEAKYAERIAAAQVREQKAKARESKKARAVENHGKYVYAGFMLAEAKKKGDSSTLRACLASLTNEKEKEAVKHLIASIGQRPAKATEAQKEGGVK